MLFAKPQYSSFGTTFTISITFSIRLFTLLVSIFVEDIIVKSKELIIPHPRLHLRKFVLTPMLDLAPDLIHPILNKSIRQLELECEDNDQPKKIDLL